ncbi:MAG: type 1 glutamine amidotransferase [Candidatus Hydrogenedentes bacterium]|nr:type 1 glutamine amidotransferase [Candidatus Hydrogenedentota bacterium]
MNAHYFQHVPFEGLGSIEGWLRRRGAAIQATRLFDSPRLPELDAIDLLIVLGGPMSVNDEAALPWLVAEKAFLREAIALGKPVLGICLGAQLIASAFGARVYPNSEKEIGWFPVTRVEGTNTSNGFVFPAETMAFHWHGETFDLPPGAVHLAQSAGCAHQAFQLGERVIGLQFHLEMTPESARLLVENCRNEMVPARYVQVAEAILAAPPARYEEINALMDRLLAYLLR